MVDVDRLFYVYGDYTDDSHLYYVGKGLEQRLAYRVRNQLHTNIAAKHGWHRKVLFVSNNEQVIKDMEIELIAEHRLNYHANPGNPFATNFTDGGDGMSGHVFTPEQLENCSIAQKKHQKKTQNRPEVVAKKAASALIAQNRPDVVEKKRAARVVALQRPGVRQRLVDGINAANQRPEVRANRSKATKDWFKQPGVKEKFYHPSRQRIIDDAEVIRELLKTNTKGAVAKMYEMDGSTFARLLDEIGVCKRKPHGPRPRKQPSDK